MEHPLIVIDDFSGGISTNPKMGRKNQFYTGNRVDFRSRPGYLRKGNTTVKYKIHEDNTDDEYTKTKAPIVKFIQSEQNDSLYGFSQLFRPKPANQAAPFPLAIRFFLDPDQNLLFSANEDNPPMTISGSPASFNNPRRIGGAVTFKGDIYFTNQYDLGGIFTHLAKVTPSYALPGVPALGTVQLNWQTLINHADYHPMIVATDNRMYVGHGNLVGSYDGNTWTRNRLDLQEKWEIRCLENFDTFLAIGANYKTPTGAPTKAKIFLWSKHSSSWEEEIEVPEGFLQSMVVAGGYLWIWAGLTANLYCVPIGGRQATLIKRFNNRRVSNGITSANLTVTPNAVAVKDGIVYFGLSDQHGSIHPDNPAGIYSFTADPQRFDLNLDYKKNGGAEFYPALGLYTRNGTGNAGSHPVFNPAGQNPITELHFSYVDMWENGFLTYNNAFLYREYLLGSADHEGFLEMTDFVRTLTYDVEHDKEMNLYTFGIEFEPYTAGVYVDPDSSCTIKATYYEPTSSQFGEMKTVTIGTITPTAEKTIFRWKFSKAITTTSIYFTFERNKTSPFEYKRFIAYGNYNDDPN